MIDISGTELKILRISFTTSLQVNVVFLNSSGRTTQINVESSTYSLSSTGSNQAIQIPLSNIISSITILSIPPPVSTNYTITIQDISPTVDFIAVTTAYSATSPIVLRLPPVTAHQRPIFIKLGRNTTASNDGVYIITRGDSFIDSVTRNTESIGGATYNHSSSVFIGGQSADGTSVNYPCITLFSDGSNWYVANYYPMNTSAFQNQHYLTTTTLPSIGDNAANSYYTNGVNVFSTDTYAARQSSKNVILLQTPSVSSLCMIVYKGLNGFPDSSNPLIIDDIRSGRFIDGFSANNPYIYIANSSGYTDTSAIVLFYDNTVTPGKWYVVGWFFSLNCKFVTTKIGQTPMADPVVPAAQARRILMMPLSSSSDMFYTLPKQTESHPQVIICKARLIDGSLSFCTRDGSTTSSSDEFASLIGNDSRSITYDSADVSSSYSCVWFVSQEGAGFGSIYYPVIAYIPGA
jgi:hypothetical protein